ncbi:MAG: exonuclease SbcCD subunit D [Lachnospiraceae bacterium]|nr:exonuclease SbcCD subunit D [Lachnospiraceae bacterium]
MKIFHLSDLHIGKQLYFYDLKNLQKKVLQMIIEQAKVHRPDVILIAGDIYDKAVPSGDAYDLFDDFLNQLADIRPSIPVLMIAGNHDHASRLNYASGFLKKHRIYVSVLPPQEEGQYLDKIVLEDEFGPVNFYLLPFTKPGYVRHLWKDKAVTDYNSAVKMLIERENIDDQERNIIIAHQFFVSGEDEPEKSDSELTYISVGGLDKVDVSCIERFDYAALGHIHRPQKIGQEHIRYCGTPLKYSVSEEHHKKGILVVTLGEKGTPNQYQTIPLVLKPDVRSIRGSLKEVIEKADEDNRNDYVSITLTDEDVFRPKDQLEEHYPNILEVKIDNQRIQAVLKEDDEENMADPMEAFSKFYEDMNGRELNMEEEKMFADILESAKQRMEREE